MGADWKRIGSGLEADWKRIGSGLEADWKRIGCGSEADWKRIPLATSTCYIQHFYMTVTSFMGVS
jgi:hypothetical protein